MRVKKVGALLALVVACWVSAMAGEMPADLLAAHEQMLYPVVRVTIKQSGGSGTLLYSEDRGDGHQTYVLTNNHVIDGAVQVQDKWDSLLQADVKQEVNDLVTVEVFRYDTGSRQDMSDTCRAEIIAHDKANDLALLRLQTPRKFDHTAKLLPESEQVLIFEKVWAVGCSLLHPPVVTEGIIDYLDEVIDRKAYWMGSANIIYGNCLPGDIMVATLEGDVAMKNLKVGDEVLTPYGPQRIIRTFPSQEKPIVELITRSRTLRASADHPVMGLSRAGKIASPNPGYRRVTVYRQDWRLAWRTAGDFKPGDPIVVQTDSEDRGEPYVLPKIEGLNHHVPPKTTDDFMRLVGCFLGDGYVRLRESQGGSFHLCLLKPAQKELYTDLLYRLFCLKAKDTKEQGIALYRKPVALLFDAIGLNKKATKKELPPWLFRLPHSQIKAFFLGLLDSDGYSNPSGAWVFEMSNEPLIRQLHQLALNVGYSTSNVHVRQRTESNLNSKGVPIRATCDSACVQLYPEATKRRCASSLPGIEYAALPPHCGTEIIREIRTLPPEEVYDIQLEGVHSFFANGVLVHNSGGAVFIRKGDQHYFIGVPSRVAVSWGQAVTHMGFFAPIPRIREWFKDEELLFLLDPTVKPTECLEKREELRRKMRFQRLHEQREPKGESAPAP